jgi:hypothetical protein
MFVGPGMKTGFWLDMGVASVWLRRGVAGGWRIGNFFEIIFQETRPICKMLVLKGLRFFTLRTVDGET